MPRLSVFLPRLILLLGLCALGAGAGPSPTWATDDSPALASARANMVRQQIQARSIDDPRVLAAMGQVPRHLFVSAALRDQAYNDHPLPIGSGQTISQPYIVAYMSQALGLRGGEKVLEVGTGSGYQAAVLARLAGSVYTIEIVPALYEAASRLLARLGHANVHTRLGDGHAGWPQEAPFAAIMVTAAAREIPPALLKQLAPGGRLILPVGEPWAVQQLILVQKDAAGRISRRVLELVRFVPLVGGPTRKPGQAPARP